MATLLLNTAYFPPIQFFRQLNLHSNILIEQFEHYEKQSYRNRCEIMTANGVISLSIPIQKQKTPKFSSKDALIDYSENWQKIHFKAIESAYKHSPYYDYYIDDYMPFFKTKEKYLIELNDKIIRKLSEHLDVKKNINYTEYYITAASSLCDMRDAIHPKASKRKVMDIEYTTKPYYQTFCDRHPFAPDLSIIDLLFNMGTESKLYLY